jgi:RNA polymerase sigma-70 factor (ECF subfamily)
MIRRVQAGDAEAWNNFAQRCRQVVSDWCRWHDVQDADVDDLVQETMLVVMARMPDFRHVGRGSLRGWLRGIAWRCWCRAIADADPSRLNELRIRHRKSADDIAELEAAYEQLFELDCLQKAMAIVQGKVSATTWQAFQLTALEGVSGNDASEKLGLTPDAVYSSRARVQRLITIELRRQTSLLPPP